jgi:hypothetical protein
MVSTYRELENACNALGLAYKESKRGICGQA